MTSFYNIYSSIFQIFLSSYDDECLRLCNSHCLSGKACSTKYLIYLPTPHVAPSQSLCIPFNKKSNKIQIFWKWKPFATIHSRPQDVMVIYIWLQKPGWMHCIILVDDGLPVANINLSAIHIRRKHPLPCLSFHLLKNNLHKERDMGNRGHRAVLRHDLTEISSKMDKVSYS